MGIEDIFNMPQEDVVETPQEVVEEVAQEVVEPVVEEPVEQAAPEVVEEPKMVPLATFLDQRDELKELKRWKQEQEAKAEVPQRQAPDPFDDPQGFQQFQNQQVQEAVVAQKFETSDLIARQAHGDETVEAAIAWAGERAKNSPAFAAEYMKERHPIDWIVRQHKQEADIADYRNDPVAFAKRILEANGQTIAAPAQVVETQQVATPARSLAAAPSKTGGVKDIPVGPMTALNTLFK